MFILADYTVLFLLKTPTVWSSWIACRLFMELKLHDRFWQSGNFAVFAIVQVSLLSVFPKSGVSLSILITILYTHISFNKYHEMSKQTKLYKVNLLKSRNLDKYVFRRIPNLWKQYENKLKPIYYNYTELLVFLSQKTKRQRSILTQRNMT